MEPLPSSAWNRITAAHLLNRAGFGATPAEIEAAAGRKPREVVRDLLAFADGLPDAPPPDWVKEPESDLRPQPRRDLMDPEARQKAQQERNRLEREHVLALRAWWLERMRSTPYPLQEKLALFWHGHFATSAVKVRMAYPLYQQNQTFRRMAAGSWRELVLAVARDPAMLIYLDNAQSRKDHPNENFARELMELFTLGEGHYTEEDIRASARAFTGWSLERDRFAFVFRAPQHDRDAKTFMGRTGALDGSDIVDGILAHPNSAPFIATKLWSFFAYEHPDRQLITELAGHFRSGGDQLRPLLEEMFLSRAFYSAQAIRTQIKSPVQWLVGTVRSLEGSLPGPGASQRMLQSLGQELFAPPNVKGWDGGYAWITANSLLNRYNLAGLLVRGGEGLRAGEPARPPGGGDGDAMQRQERRRRAMARLTPLIDVEKLLPPEHRGSADDAIAWLEGRLFAAPLPPEDHAALRACVGSLPLPAQWTTEDLRSLVHTMMSTPHFQLT